MHILKYAYLKEYEYLKEYAYLKEYEYLKYVSFQQKGDFMHYYNTPNTNLEALLLEFLEFRNARGPAQFKRQSLDGLAECPKGAPEFVAAEPLFAKGSQLLEEGSKPAAQAEDMQDEGRSPAFAPEYHEQYYQDYAHHLMGEVLSAVMPHALEVLNNQELGVLEHITRERLAQLVDMALRAASIHPEVQLVLRHGGSHPWHASQLLRAVMEAAIIFELYYRRKPIYHRLRENGWQ